LNESVGLGTLFLSSFLAATLLPGGSEDANAVVAALR
jgi:membrane protein YqaA with SNARE-associated domain